jgi:hypothetical protein
LTLPFPSYKNYFATGALVLGTIKKHGIPKFSKDYLQRVMFDDNF